jgi:AraC-like DNA-binding protein
MICKRIKPELMVNEYVKEYLLLHMKFDSNEPQPIKAYPVNPEEGMTFQIKGAINAESPELEFVEKRSKTYFFGLPASRQNLCLSHEFMLVHVRFHPGAMHKMTKIPMNELVHKNIDAELIWGSEIAEINDRLCNAENYDKIPLILDAFFLKKINQIKYGFLPIEKIGRLIIDYPTQFNLDKFASNACLSHRAFEKRFVQQIGITPKYFARISRFYQAYALKETNRDLDWLSVAIQTGYTDYQHLVKDFKQFSGTTPNKLINESNLNPERRLKLNPDFVGV